MTRIHGTPQPGRLIFDARTVNTQMGGVGRYALNLLHALNQNQQSPPLVALIREDVLDTASQDPGLAGVELWPAPPHEQHPFADLWLRYSLPRRLVQGDVFHGAGFLVPGGRQPFVRVSTIHDLFVFTHPAAYPLQFRWWLRRMITQACRNSNFIITPSNAIFSQLVELQLAPASRVHVVYEAPDRSGLHWNSPSANAAPQLPEPPYLLTVATADPRKDPATARRAWLQLKHRSERQLPENLKWVWAGGNGPLPDPSPRVLVEEAANAGFIQISGLPHQSMQRLYRDATALVTCSHAEGFGLPLVEAMAAGLPLVASDLSVHREVVGDAALYYPPGAPDELAATLERLLTSRDLQHQQREASRKRSRQYDWARAARETLGIYRPTGSPIASSPASGHEM